MIRQQHRAAYEPQRGARGAAWVVVALVHALVVGLWLSQPGASVQRALQTVSVLLPPLAAPPPPPPEEPPPAPPQNQPAPQPAPRPRPSPPPPPVATPAAPARAPAGPPVHLRGGDDEWAQPASPSAAVAPPSARRAPPDYAEQVKARVMAQVVYPRNAVMPRPRDFKGDPRDLLRECTIPYEVLVDRQGRIISFEIERCQDDLLDAAAEAAIRKAQPFAPPPAGAEQYRIYGSINFVKPPLKE